MIWIRNNKFLAVFIAVMVVGVGALGYLLWDSMGKYDQVSQDYNTQVTEMKRLEGLPLYPDQDNLAKYQEVETGYKQAVGDLRAKMAAFEPPPQNPPFTPTEFQDHLRKVVDEKIKAADQYGIAYPTDFYMGFERYRNALPEAAATPLLTSQLDNIEELVSFLLKERVEKIGKVNRAVFPQENGGAPVNIPPAVKGAPNQPAAGDLVTKLPVVLDFSGPPNVFRAVLNDITHSKRLFVVRALKITNQSDKGPARGAEAPAGGVAAAPTPGADANATPGEPLPEKGPPPLRYVVGQEKIDVVARIELARVAPLR